MDHTIADQLGITNLDSTTLRCFAEDGGYIATFSDYPTLSGFGETPSAAVGECLIAYHLAFVPPDARLHDNARLRAEVAQAQAERDAIGLRVTHEWQKIVDVLIEVTKDDLAQNLIEGLIEYGPRFYAGKLSVLQHFREMIGDDLQRFSNGAALLAERDALRDALQRYVDGDGCEYADDPPECPGDTSEGIAYAVECRWHQAMRALGQKEEDDERLQT